MKTAIRYFVRKVGDLEPASHGSSLEWYTEPEQARELANNLNMAEKLRSGPCKHLVEPIKITIEPI